MKFLTRAEANKIANENLPNVDEVMGEIYACIGLKADVGGFSVRLVAKDYGPFGRDQVVGRLRDLGYEVDVKRGHIDLWFFISWM
jgi:hypothetical protein